MKLSGVVLAGGASTRMGSDKATMMLGGQRMVDRAVATLRELSDDVMVAPGARPLEVADATLVDDAEGGGPLSGIVGALRRAQHPLLAVVAVDMPAVSTAVLGLLAQSWEGECAVAPVVDGVIQPLHAVYATGWVERYAEVLAAGQRSPRRALRQLGARLVGPEVWSELDPAGGFAGNLNSEAAVDAYRAARRPAG